jgi:hypothetical protein
LENGEFRTETLFFQCIGAVRGVIASGCERRNGTQ